MTTSLATVWFVMFLFLVFVEVATVGLVSIWFAIGAMAALITTYFTDSFLIQIIVFLVVSILSLVSMSPIIKKLKIVKVEPTNLDRVIGKKAEVIKEIGENKVGEVKVLGSVWSAVSDKTINVGEMAIVEKIDGVKLIVRKEKK